SEILFFLGRWDEAEAVLPARNRGEGSATLANLLLRRASLMLGRGDVDGARKAIEHSRAFIADSVEPQYIAPAGALMVELGLREAEGHAAAGEREAAGAAAARALAGAEDLGSEWLAAEVAGLIARARLPRAGAASGAAGRSHAGNGGGGTSPAGNGDDNPFD